MNALLLYFLVSLPFLNAVPRCQVYAPGAVTVAATPVCTTIEMWRANIVCRVIGPTPPAALPLSSYAQDATIQRTDTRQIIGIKNWAMGQLNNILTTLNSNDFNGTNYNYKQKMLVYYEQILTKVGSAMYGVNWAQAPTKCGINQELVDCGDKGVALTATVNPACLTYVAQ